jgi:hypothetical protein
MNECIPLESEEEESVGSELETEETAAVELNGLTARKLSELVLPRTKVKKRQRSERVLVVEVDDGIGRMVVTCERKQGREMKNRRERVYEVQTCCVLEHL